MPIFLISAAVLLGLFLWSDDEARPALMGSAKLPPNPVGDFIPGDRVIIIGLPLSGKTYLAGKLTKNVPRILFFDPYHDYAEYGATEIEADDLLADPTILNRSTFRYAIIPDEDDLAEQLDLCVKVARAAGNLVFVMDEVGDYKQKGSLTLEKLARNGRHNGLVPIYVSQVAMDIPRTVRRLATKVYSFRQADIDDLDALAERYGEKYAQEVSRLPRRKFALWTLQDFDRKAQDPSPQSGRQGQPSDSTRPDSRETTRRPSGSEFSA